MMRIMRVKTIKDLLTHNLSHNELLWGNIPFKHANYTEGEPPKTKKANALRPEGAKWQPKKAQT